MKKKPIFIQGPVSASFIGESIAKHQTKTDIGAHEIFLGQVRADDVRGKTVGSIVYSAYEEMVESKAAEIRESAFQNFKLSCIHIYHSLGEVKAGEICFFVFVSSSHREEARKATAYIVDAIKSELPIFGKEMLSDKSHQWKTNSN